MKSNLKLQVVVIALLAFVSSITLVLSPYYLGFAIDSMVGVSNVDFQSVIKYMGIAGVMYLLNFILTWAVALVSNNVAVNYVYHLRNKLKDKLNALPLSVLDRKQIGNLQALFSNDGELVIDGLNQFINQALSGVFVIIISLFFMLRINIFMTIVTVSLVPIMYYTAQFITKRSLKLHRQQQQLSAEISSLATESINNSQLIMTHNYQEAVKDKFDTLNQKLRNVSEKAIFIAALPNPTTRFVNNIGYMLIGLTGAYAVFEFGLTVGFLTSFVSYSILFSKPFNELSGIVSQISSAKAGYDRIQEILALGDEVDPEKFVALKGEVINFDDVSFSYDGKTTIIKNLNLEVNEKSKVAIVGPTGAGKSTLINLLMKYYEVSDGVLKIDDVDTKLVSKESSRSLMAIVLQDPWLFHGTIKDNIKYGNPNASDEAVVDAAVKAGVHDYIESLDEGYETVVELGSKNVSLGQRQMITIARALLIDAPIIILDEATSSLDVVTEQKIQKVFTTIMKEKTSFFIAHRLNTVIDSDVILVMKDGQLIEQGNHQSLLELKGFYYQLYLSQSKNDNSSN